MNNFVVATGTGFQVVVPSFDCATVGAAVAAGYERLTLAHVGQAVYPLSSYFLTGCTESGDGVLTSVGLMSRLISTGATTATVESVAVVGTVQPVDRGDFFNSLSLGDAGLLSVAIAGLWALAWALRHMGNQVKDS